MDTNAVETGAQDIVEQIPNPPEWLTQALSVPREQGFVTVNGCRLRYYRWGDKSKPGVLMTHGFLAHSRCFAFIAPLLANDFHLVAFDMSGMGESDGHHEYPVETRVDELVGVAEQTGLFDNGAKPIIVAHSFGGMIATATSFDHGDKFAGLVICDLMIIRPEILAKNKDRFGPPGSNRADKPQKVYPDYETAKQRFVLSPPQKVNEPALFDYMAYHSLKQVEDGWSWKFDPSVFRRGPGMGRRWSEIGKYVAEAPIRKAIVYGRDSMLFPPDSVNYMNELCDAVELPRIPMIGIPEARHHLMLDQPIAFASTIDSILKLWTSS